MVSMIVPTIAQTPLVGYRLVVAALVATGFLSFGLWVHHMFATGLPQLSLSFFYGRQHGGGDPQRHPGLRLDRHAGGRQEPQHHDADAVRARLPVHLRARRADRRDGGGGAVRLAGARHLLRRRPSALRADRRHGVPAVRGLLLLGAVLQRASAVGARRPLGLRPHVHRLQRHLLPDAHLGPAGHAAARLHLPGRPRTGRR